MMRKLVYRRDSQGRIEGEPQLCVDPDGSLDEGSFVGEHIAKLLRDGEQPIRERANCYAVIQGGEKIAFIEILEVRMPELKRSSND